MFCGNYILSNGSRWTFYFSKVFNLILQSALIYKYKKTSNHEVTVNSEMNEKFLTSKDLKNTDYQFNEDKMYKNGIVYHNYSVYKKKDETERILQEIANNIKDLKINDKE